MDGFEDIYKNSIEGGSEIPEGVWENISENLDLNSFENDYKQSVEQGTIVPDDVWSGISEQLDIEDVWNLVRDDLDKQDRIRFWKRMATGIAAILLAILGGIGLFSKLDNPANSSSTPGTSTGKDIGSSDNNQPNSFTSESIVSSDLYSNDPTGSTQSGMENKAFDRQESNPDLKSSDSDKEDEKKLRKLLSVVPENLKGNEVKPFPTGKDHDSESPNGDQLISSESIRTVPKLLVTVENHFTKPSETSTTSDGSGKIFLPETNPEATPENKLESTDASPPKTNNLHLPFIAYVPARVWNPEFTVSPEEITGGVETAQEESSDRKDLQIRFIGVTGTYRNHWLMNYDTYNGFKKQEISSTRITFGKAAGGEVGLSYKNVNATIQIHGYSQKGGAYLDYIRGKLIDRSIDLNYYNANVLFKPFNTSKKNSNVVVGLYTSYLNKATVTYSKGSEEANKTYSRIDYGLIAGKEYIVKLNPQWSLVSGITFSYGLNNIFKGSDQMPASFNKTRNLSVNGNVSVRYFLK